MRMRRSPTPYPERMPLRKGTWSAEEDQKLIAYIKKYGIWSWSHMPKAAGLLRSGKSCRLRWVNYLRPGLKHGNLSAEEVEIILKLHNQLGNKWTLIAAKLPGRSDNEIKNYWHTHLSKRAKVSDLLLEVKGSLVESKVQNVDLPENGALLPIAPTVSDSFDGYKGIPVSPQLSAGNSKSISDTFYGTYTDYAMEEVGSFESYEELPNFWEQPFSLDALTVPDNFVGNKGISMSPQVSAVNSTSISDPFCRTYTDYAIEEVGSFESYGEISNFWEPQLSLEDVEELWSIL